MTAAESAITRRAFVFGASAAVGGLVLIAPSAAQNQVTPVMAARPELTVWVSIHEDDRVFIRVAKSDMGQGIFTALPMLVAEELECDWSKVTPVYASVAEQQARGRPWGSMVTTDSLSVRGSQEYLRKAGAQARTMLLQEAAARWACPVAECEARNGVVRHASSGRQLRFGQLAAAAAKRPIPAEVALKQPGQWRLIGKSIPQFDVEAKSVGAPIFAGDVRLPGMLYAAVRACPTQGGKLAGFEAAGIRDIVGVKHVVRVGETAVAVIADSWWRAQQAVEKLDVRWDAGSAAAFSSASFQDSLRADLDAADAFSGRQLGDVAAAFGSASRVHTAEYAVPYLAHATMEPQTCTAIVTADRAEVWAPTQNGENTLAAVAAAVGLDPSRVIVHKCHLGGGFGRRGISQDWARQAAIIAKTANGVPVKMQWSRQEDMTHDYYRPLVVARMSAAIGAGDTFAGLKIRVAGPSVLAQLAPQFLRNGQDPSIMNGFLQRDMVYDVANLDVSAVMRPGSVPVGFWRGVNYSQNAFFREAFIDEVAAAVRADPYMFRRQLLSKAPRSLAVLDAAARRANWGRPAAGRYQGIAIAEFHEAICAQVVEISIGADGALKVHRIVCAVEAGHIVHPDIVIAQMEGSIIQGLGAALAGEITFKDGVAEQSSFADYSILRIHETPEMEILILPPAAQGPERWGAVGETGVPPVAPALVNAIHAATGQRVRTLPVKNHTLRPRTS